MSTLITRREMLRNSVVAAGVWTATGALSRAQGNSPTNCLTSLRSAWAVAAQPT